MCLMAVVKIIRVQKNDADRVVSRHTGSEAFWMGAGKTIDWSLPRQRVGKQENGR